MSDDKKKYYEVIEGGKEFFDDEFGVYYDGEFYEEVEEEAVKQPSESDANEALIKEIARLRSEIKNLGSDKPSAPLQQPVIIQTVAQAPAQRAAEPNETDGYQLMLDLEALKAFLKKTTAALSEKIERMLEFNRRVSQIPYGQHDELVAAFGILKSGFLWQKITNNEVIDVISYKNYSHDILSEADEVNAREFLLFKELYNPNDERNYYEIAGRIVEAKNRLQENCSTERNESVYSQILDIGADLLSNPAMAIEKKARLRNLFDELLSLTLEDVINFPDIIRPGQKTVSSSQDYALLDEMARMRQEIERLRNESAATTAPTTVIVQEQVVQPQPAAKPSPFPPRVVDPNAPPKVPKPDNIRKAHNIARVIANRMILDNLMDEISEEDLTRDKRDKLVKKMVPGAARIDEQPKDLQKLANTLVVDKLEAINKKYEKMQKLRDKQIKQEARQKAAEERAEKLRLKQEKQAADSKNKDVPPFKY